MNRYQFVPTLFMAASLSLPVAAQQATATPEPLVKSAAEVTTLTAKVEAVDLQNRTVDVVGPLGRKITLKVDEQVKNLPQVKVGDHVVVKYSEALTLELKKGSSSLMKTETSTGPLPAPAGAKPSAAEVKRTTIDANVEKVDTKRSILLVRGPGGRHVELKVKDPAVMKRVKVGDQIQATFTEAIVIDVMAPDKQ